MRGRGAELRDGGTQSKTIEPDRECPRLLLNSEKREESQASSSTYLLPAVLQS